MQADKVITSPLFSSEMGRDASAILSMRFEELIQQKKYHHSVPALKSTALKDGSVECVLDFTDHLNNSLEYCRASISSSSSMSGSSSTFFYWRNTGLFDYPRLSASLRNWRHSS
jgi:hypothetical protein